MLKRKINKVLIVIGLITALLGIALGTFNYINSKKVSKLEEEKINIFIKEYEEQINKVSKKQIILLVLLIMIIKWLLKYQK